jgi:hypothetical protein
MRQQQANKNKKLTLHPDLVGINPRVKAIIEVQPPRVSPLLKKLIEPPVPKLTQPLIGAGLPTQRSSAVLEFISFDL